MTFPITDINGNQIHDGDQIRYNGNDFIVNYIGKDGVEWVFYPCANTLLDQPIEVASIPLTMDDYGLQFELIKRV